MGTFVRAHINTETSSKLTERVICCRYLCERLNYPGNPRNFSIFPQKMSLCRRCRSASLATFIYLLEIQSIAGRPEI